MSAPVLERRPKGAGRLLETYPQPLVSRCPSRACSRRRKRIDTLLPSASQGLQAAAPQTGAKPSEAIRASYQGTAQAGHPTAGGEPHNPNDLTAASRTLPVGSSVVVTNPATGSSVKVRINDRGPYVRGRSLDLSKRAAEKIGMARKLSAAATRNAVDRP